jgi:hypothetical protein
MRQFLHWLLNPARTLPVDPYAWRRDNRSVSEKVVSGIRLAVGLVAGFLVIVLVFGGISTLPDGAPAYGRYGLFVSWSMLCAGTIVMLWTANRWAPYLPGFFCLPAVLKTLAVILVGPDPKAVIAWQRLSRTDAAEVFAACVVVIALTWRFLGRRPAATTFLDRLALTFFVLAAIKQVVTPYHWPPRLLISGFVGLLSAWCAYRWNLHQGRTRLRRQHVSPD